MGYRSDAALALSQEGVAALARKLAGNDSRIPAVQRLLDRAGIHYQDAASGAEIWQWDWLKWYPEYQDVSVLENLMAELDEVHFRFIRIGEDEEDTEVRGLFRENPFQMNLIRGIQIEAPQPVRKG